jgi:hypothetical protein
MGIAVTLLKDKVQDALDESRMLVLGAEILIGFEFTAVLQAGFSGLSATAKNANMIALALMLSVLSLLIAPCVFHQITARGDDRREVHGFSSRIMNFALLPFAAGLGLTVYIPADRISGGSTADALALMTVLLAAIFCYGPAFVCKPEGMQTMTSNLEEGGATSLHDKIRQVLTEARVIIPGNQALLGFQFAVILQQGFMDLPPWTRWIHLFSLLLITISTILLMTPAAFHRIVEHGEETNRFYHVTQSLVLWSLPALALGICSDFFIVLLKTSSDLLLSSIGSGLMLLLFILMWFGYPFWRRRRTGGKGKSCAWQEGYDDQASHH